MQKDVNIIAAFSSTVLFGVANSLWLPFLSHSSFSFGITTLIFVLPFPPALLSHHGRTEQLLETVCSVQKIA